MSVHSRLRSARRRVIMWYKRNRYGFRHVHRTAYFAGRSRIRNDIEVGQHSFINAGAVITSKTRMGRYVLLGPNVSIVGDNHRFDLAGTPMIFSGLPAQNITTIEDDVWIGLGSIIMSGVTIGRGSIVAAGSVVTRNIPPFEIHGGVPNKKIRDRFHSPEELTMHETMLDGPTVSGSYNMPRPYMEPES